MLVHNDLAVLAALAPGSPSEAPFLMSGWHLCQSLPHFAWQLARMDHFGGLHVRNANTLVSRRLHVKTLVPNGRPSGCEPVSITVYRLCKIVSTELQLYPSCYYGFLLVTNTSRIAPLVYGLTYTFVLIEHFALWRGERSASDSAASGSGSVCARTAPLSECHLRCGFFRYTCQLRGHGRRVSLYVSLCVLTRCAR